MLCERFAVGSASLASGRTQEDGYTLNRYLEGLLMPLLAISINSLGMIRGRDKYG